VEALFAQVQQPNPLTAGGPLGIISNICGLVAFVCYVWVIVKMFQHGQTGLAVGCILGLCVCGIGYLVAFIYGWVKSGEWKLMPVMGVWTVMLLISWGLGGDLYVTHPALYQMPTNPNP